MSKVNTTDATVTAFYLLLRDHITAGEIEKIISELEYDASFVETDPETDTKLWVLSNQHIVSYASEIVARLNRCTTIADRKA